jgi:(p)ppGpp synthase/HD superfamily hydrolase
VGGEVGGKVNPVLDIARAFDFAARRHSSQRRKGSAGEPYVNHLAEVARLVAEATGGADSALVVAALLHDTVEDTGTELGELTREFGPEVSSLVLEVTDDKSLPDERRKRLQVETAASKSVRARMLKIADKTSNLRSLAASPPSGWSARRIRDHVAWAREVVDRCRGVSPALEARFDEAWGAASGGRGGAGK